MVKRACAIFPQTVNFWAVECRRTCFAFAFKSHHIILLINHMHVLVSFQINLDYKSSERLSQTTKKTMNGFEMFNQKLHKNENWMI